MAASTMSRPCSHTPSYGGLGSYNALRSECGDIPRWGSMRPNPDTCQDKGYSPTDDRGHFKALGVRGDTDGVETPSGSTQCLDEHNAWMDSVQCPLGTGCTTTASGGSPQGASNPLTNATAALQQDACSSRTRQAAPAWQEDSCLAEGLLLPASTRSGLCPLGDFTGEEAGELARDTEPGVAVQESSGTHSTSSTKPEQHESAAEAATMPLRPCSSEGSKQQYSPKTWDCIDLGPKPMLEHAPKQRCSPRSMLEDLDLRILTERLRLLTSQRELAAIKCQRFTEMLERAVKETQGQLSSSEGKGDSRFGPQPTCTTRSVSAPTRRHRRTQRSFGHGIPHQYNSSLGAKAPARGVDELARLLRGRPEGPQGTRFAVQRKGTAQSKSGSMSRTSVQEDPDQQEAPEVSCPRSKSAPSTQRLRQAARVHQRSRLSVCSNQGTSPHDMMMPRSHDSAGYA